MENGYRYKFLVALIAGFLACGCGLASAQEANGAAWYTKVGSIIIDDANYGGCAVNLSVPPSAQSALNCSTAWLSLDCSGVVNTKSQGAAKLAAAQLAFVTQQCIRVAAYDLPKFNGHCYGVQITNTTNTNC